MTTEERDKMRARIAAFDKLAAEKVELEAFAVALRNTGPRTRTLQLSLVRDCEHAMEPVTFSAGADSVMAGLLGIVMQRVELLARQLEQLPATIT